LEKWEFCPSEEQAFPPCASKLPHSTVSTNVAQILSALSHFNVPFCLDRIQSDDRIFVSIVKIRRAKPANLLYLSELRAKGNSSIHLRTMSRIDFGAEIAFPLHGSTPGLDFSKDPKHFLPIEAFFTPSSLCVEWIALTVVVCFFVFLPAHIRHCVDCPIPEIGRPRMTQSESLHDCHKDRPIGKFIHEPSARPIFAHFSLR
jgi:hypothetical protein